MLALSDRNLVYKLFVFALIFSILNPNIFDACIKGRLDIINKLIKTSLNFNSLNRNGSYPIHLAVYYDHLDAVKLLIKNGANYNIKDGSGLDPLYIACYFERLEVVRYLIGLKVDVNLLKDGSQSPLYAACVRGNLEIAKALIKAGAKISTGNGFSPLLYSVQTGKLNMVKLMTDLGADLDGKNDNGSTPLILASRQNYIEIIAFLLSNYVDIFAIDKFVNKTLKKQD